MSTKTFTWEELAQHNIEGDLFVGYRGRVYDVTKFLDRHPGGTDALLIGAGRDITQVFESYHKSTTADIYLKKFYVGDLITNEYPTFPPPSAFEISIKRKVADMFTSTGRDPKNYSGMWIRYAIILGIVFIGYYSQFYIPFVVQHPWLQYFFAIVQAFGCSFVGLNFLHDGSHFSLTHHPLVWKLGSGLNDFINGTSSHLWIYQHGFGHHPYTNILGADPDATVKGLDLYVRRIHPDQSSWAIHFLYQHWYLPFLYAVSTTKFKIVDLVAVLISGQVENIRLNPMTNSQLIYFWGGKFFFIFYRILLPIWFSSVSIRKVFGLFIFSEVILSYWLGLNFVVNHLIENVSFPVPDKDGIIQRGWAEIQVEASQEFAHGSWWWAILSGGLNYQAVHHLFPGVHQFYYPEIAALLKIECKEHNVQYIVRESFWEAIQAHLAELQYLGVQPNKAK